MTILTFTFRFLSSPLFSLFVASFFPYFAGLLVGFILVGIAFYRTLLGLNERKGRWVVQQDFHGKFQSNVTWVFAFFSVVLDWIVLILVWFERSLHSLTIKTDDVTIGRRDEGGNFGFQVTGVIEWDQITKPQKIPCEFSTSKISRRKKHIWLYLNRKTTWPGYTGTIMFWIAKEIPT